MTTAVALSPLPRFQFNQNGVPLAGGLLFTYAAGTTTKQTTYQDSGGNTQNPNPIVLDANGQCVCFLVQNESYKLVLSPANDTDPPTNPFWTQDGVSAASGGSGGGVQLFNVNVFTKNQSVAIVALTDAATVAFDASASNSFELLATSAVGGTRKIGYSSTTPTGGMVCNLFFYQDATGSRALTWDTSYQGPNGGAVPAASTAPNAIDLYSMIYSATKSKWIVNQLKGS